MNDSRAAYAADYALHGIHASWRTYHCWCGRTYRSPEADCTRKPLYTECDAHILRPRVQRFIQEDTAREKA